MATRQNLAAFLPTSEPEDVLQELLMGLIACLIEVTVHYGAAYHKLRERQDAESFSLVRGESLGPGSASRSTLGGQEGQRLHLPKGSIFLQRRFSQPSTANAFQRS